MKASGCVLKEALDDRELADFLFQIESFFQVYGGYSLKQHHLFKAKTVSINHHFAAIVVLHIMFLIQLPS